MDSTARMYQDLSKILVTQSEIQKAVRELGRRITEDYQGTEREFVRYAALQRLMIEIVKLLVNHEGFDRFCDKAEVDYTRPINIEWEYNEYGGYNGLSITFRLNDKEVV